MRHHARPAGPLVLAAVLMAGCGAGPEQPLGAPDPPAPVETTVAPAPTTTGQVPEAPTTTTTPIPLADIDEDVDGGNPDVDAGGLGVDPHEVDELLAEIETSLVGLDQLLNDAAAGLAAEEGEIIP